MISISHPISLCSGRQSARRRPRLAVTNNLAELGGAADYRRHEVLRRVLSLGGADVNWRGHTTCLDRADSAYMEQSVRQAHRLPAPMPETPRAEMEIATLLPSSGGVPAATNAAAIRRGKQIEPTITHVF